MESMALGGAHVGDEHGIQTSFPIPTTPSRRSTRRSLRISQINSNTGASMPMTASPLKKKQHLHQQLAPKLLPPTPAKTSTPRTRRPAHQKQPQQTEQEITLFHLAPPQKSFRAWDRQLTTSVTGKKVWKRRYDLRGETARAHQGIGNRVDQSAMRASKRLRGTQGGYLETHWDGQGEGSSEELLERPKACQSPPRRRKRVKRDSTTQKSEILPEALALENASDLPGADIEIHDAAYATTADANSESNLSDASKSEIEPQEPLNAEDESLHSGTEIDAGEEEEPQTEINQSLDDWTTGKQDADHVTACKLDEKLNTQDKENLTASEPAPLSKEWSPTKSITSNKIAIASSDSDRLEEDAQGEAAANLDAEITSSVTASESDPEESAEEEEEDVAAEEQLENELHDAETELNTEEAEDDVLAEAESCSPDAASENVEDESDETESLEVEGAHHVEELVTESLSPLSKSFQSIMESSGKNEKAQAVVVDVAEVFEGASPTDSKEQEETQPPKPAPASSRFSKYSSFVTDDDTALLNSFLSSSKAKKAEREAQGSPEKALPIRMDSPKSPRNVLTEVDNNSSSPILSRPSVETLSASVKSDVVESSAEKQEETFEDNNASEIIPQKQDEDEDVETTRRSTRTRNTRTTTNINVRRPTGNEFVFLQRSEEQERMLTTKRNTKKNKGDALLAPHYIEWMKQQGNPELPASPPKKRSKTRGKDKASAAEPSSDSNSASTASSSVSEESAARPKKSVVWDEELAYYKEDTPEPEMELDESPAAPRSTRKATHDRMRAKQAAVATAKVIGTPVAKKTKSILITPAKSKSKETSHSESETAPSSAAIPPPFTVQIPAPSSESAIPKPKSLGPLLKKKSSTIPMAMLKKASATVTAPTESVAAEEAKGEKKTVALKGKIPTPKPRMRIGTPAPKRARNVL